MTPQEKHHAVETAIRKALPRLQEPTEGCRILEKGKAEENHSVILAIGMYYKIYTPFGDKFSLNEIESEEDLLAKYEILGHDILLSDVLGWLERLEWHEEIDDADYIKIDIVEGHYDYSWNFSKPRLADQSEELWNLLYDLIEQ